MKGIAKSYIKFIRLNACKRILYSIFTLFFPIIFCFIPFFVTRFNIFSTYTSRMWIGILFGGTWIALAPYLILSYVEKICHLFKILSSKKISDNIFSIRKKALKSFFKLDLFSFLWMIVISLALLIDINYLKRFGINGYSDPYCYIFIFFILIILLFTSYGFKGVYVTSNLIKNLIKDKNINIDFFSIDEMGGIKCIKSMVSYTTRLFATGTLFVPILLDYILYTKSVYVKMILYLGIVVLSVSIILSYCIPMRAMAKYSNSKKDEYLNVLFLEYKEIAEKRKDNTININNELKALNLHNYISFAKKVSLYKIDSSIIFELFASIIIPIATLFININDIYIVIQSIFS